MKTNPQIRSVPVSGAVVSKAAPRPALPPKPALPAGMKHDKALLLDVFHIQNPSRNRACNDHAMKTIEKLAPPGCTVVRNRGNLLIRKGPAKGPHPYFLSHMDQVHGYEPFMRVLVNGNVLSAVDGNDKQCGVGGDDKCGIYLALRMLWVLDHCTAVFVRDEEVGCLGSGEVPLAWFQHAAFVMQADRNNRTMDIIRNTNGMNCASDGFIDALMGLPMACAAKHSENTGSVTDVGELASRGLDISMVNISSGYHAPHSHTETVHLDELGIACQLAFEAASLLGGQAWVHGATSPYFCPPSAKGYGGTAQGYGNSYSREVAKYGDGWPPVTGWSLEQEQEENEYWSKVADKERGLLDADEVDAQRREGIIGILCDIYGHDRQFDCLDIWDTEDLLDLLDEEEAAGTDPRG